MMITAAAGSCRPLAELMAATTAQIRSALGDRRVDLLLAFFTNHFEDEASTLAGHLREELEPSTLLGVSGEGVIGPEHEHEGEPALSLWAAAFPDGTQVQPFRLEQAAVEETDTAEAWTERLGGTGGEETPTTLLFADPFSLDVNTLFQRVNAALPVWTLVGGMASGAESPGQAALILDGEVYRDGAVGVTLSGAVRVDTVVSQGCRPIGPPYVITKLDRNIILELGGQPPLARLNQIYSEASGEDRELMKRGVFLGRAIKETLAKFQRGDFLIRNLLGADERSGAVAVGDLLRLGTTVQFHVRDAVTAGEDLRALVAPQATPAPAGALLFSCNGRGRRLFNTRDHDLGVVHEHLPGLPVAGFFCAGEFGPVGGRNFIHGHTASLAFFRPVE